MNKCAKHFYLMSVVVTVYLARMTRRRKSLAFQMTHSKLSYMTDRLKNYVRRLAETF
jgi:hypothetical protein